MSTSKQKTKCVPFSLKLKQYISKLLSEGMEPNEIIKDLGLPEHSVHIIVKLKSINEKRMEFKKIAANWKHAADAAEKKVEAARPPVVVKKVKKVPKVSDDPKKKNSSVEKMMVKKVEKAMLEWLNNENDGITLYNVLEKAEMLSNDVFTNQNHKRRGFKVTEGWFRDFRKRYGVKFRYAEEIEKCEAKKLAKKLETVVPDFVWGECAGCDGTDCPVHEWISTKPKKKEEQTKAKTVSETTAPTVKVTVTQPETQSVSSETTTIPQPVVSIQNPVQMLSIEGQPTISIQIKSNPIQPTISSAQFQYSPVQPTIQTFPFCNSISTGHIQSSPFIQPELAMSSVQCFQSPIFSVQTQPVSNMLGIHNGGATVQSFTSPILSVQTPPTLAIQPTNTLQNGNAICLNGTYNKVQTPVPMDVIEVSNDSTSSDSDSSALVIAGEEEEEEEEDDEVEEIVDEVKAEEPTISFMNVKIESVVGAGSSDLVRRKKKIKDAVDLFMRGMSLLEENDLFVERKQLFREGLDKLLDLYQLSEKK